MNQDLKLVLEITQIWFKSNIMLLNYDKTAFMQLSSSISYWFKVNTQSVDCNINITNSIKFYVPVTVHREQSVKKEYQQDTTI